MNDQEGVKSTRQYELILLGATGYTGKFAAHHLTASAPTDLRWAIAGRNESKLAILATELKDSNSDREAPGIVVCELNEEELDALAKRTRLIVNTVGPYVKYGTPVVEACVNNGTHYVDCSGEIPWQLDIIKAYHERAQANGAIIIPQCGFDSVPADIITYSLVTYIRQTFSCGTAEVIAALDEVSAPSGGSMNTLFTGPKYHTPDQVAAAYKPFALSSTQPPAINSPKTLSWRQRLLGTRWDKDLGNLAGCFQSTMDTALVQRSWGLFDHGKLYGDKFAFSEWSVAGGDFSAVLKQVGFRSIIWMLSLAPVRALMKRFAFQPGEGADSEATKNDYAHIKAIGVADNSASDRAMAIFKFDGSLYSFTGLAVAEAAITILRCGLNEAKICGGGVLTPATLGEPFIERLKSETQQKIEIRVETV